MQDSILLKDNMQIKEIIIRRLRGINKTTVTYVTANNTFQYLQNLKIFVQMKINVHSETVCKLTINHLLFIVKARVFKAKEKIALLALKDAYQIVTGQGLHIQM